MSSDRRELSLALSLRSELKDQIFERLSEYKSSHLTEALAVGLGYRTNTALTSDLETSQPVAISGALIDRMTMAERLSQLSAMDANVVSLRIKETLSAINQENGRIIAMVGVNSQVLIGSREQKRRAAAVLMPLLSLAVSRHASDIWMLHNDGHATFRLRIDGRNQEIDFEATSQDIVDALTILSNGIYPDANRFPLEVDGLSMRLRTQFMPGNWPGQRPIIDLGANVRLLYPIAQ